MFVAGGMKVTMATGTKIQKCNRAGRFEEKNMLIRVSERKGQSW